MERTVRFGAGEKPIRNGQVSGRTFSFAAQGEHAHLNVTLTIQDDRMSGEQYAGGPTTRFDLKKVQ